MIRSTRYSLLATLLLAGVAAAADESPAVVYRWNAADWLTKYNPKQFDATLTRNADGSEGARVISKSPNNPYNHIIVTSAGLQGGKEYTAVVNCTVVEPTGFPTTFYMYARNSAGNQYDIWANWIGLPGETRTITLPLDLKQIEGGKWTLAVGISKSGGLDVHSIAVYSGLTNDGKTPFKSIPPDAGGVAKAELPDGVTAATGYTDFTIAPPADAKKTISLADYGFVADSPEAATANAAALQKALNDAKAAGSATVTIPKGVYRLDSSKALNFDSLTDVTIDGNGSTLMFEKISKDGPAILIQRCARMVLQNINFDWDWDAIPIATLGTVSNLSADRLQCDVIFPDLSAAQTALAMKTPWRSMMRMDPQTLYRDDVNVFQVPKTATIKPGPTPTSAHVTFPNPAPLEEGKSYCIRHLYYEMSAFKSATSSDVTFRNVNILSMPGMGWFFSGGMQNFELLDCHIQRPPGGRHPLTTAADGFHADQFVSNLRLINCSVTGAGDDAMNLHNESYQGQIVFDESDKTKITLLHCPSYQLRLNPGDAVEIYNNDFSNLGRAATPVTRTVAATSSNNTAKPQTTSIQFTEPLPEGVTPQSILVNGRYATRNLLVRDCRAEYTNGRGFLISAKDVTIESNVFDHVFGSGINIESDIMPPLWTEGRGASNMVIRGNMFKDLNQQVRYNGAAIYANVRMPYGPTDAMLYDRITIENNRFINMTGPIVSLTNTNNLLVRGNEVGFTGQPFDGRYTGTLFLSRISNAALGGNTWVNASSDSGGVLYDPTTTQNLSAEGNVRREAK